MTAVLGIDPGPHTSGCALFDSEANIVLRAESVVENADVFDWIEELRSFPLKKPKAVAIERVAAYGLPVGEDVFATVFWSGRFFERAHALALPVGRLKFQEVTQFLCHRGGGVKESSVKQAICDLFGGGKPASGPAIGVKKAPGPLYELSGDHAWSAFAVALTWLGDTR